MDIGKAIEDVLTDLPDAISEATAVQAAVKKLMATPHPRKVEDYARFFGAAEDGIQMGLAKFADKVEAQLVALKALPTPPPVPIAGA